MGDTFTEADKGEGKEDGSYGEEHDKRLVHDLDTGSPEEDGLTKFDEVSSRGGEHDILYPFRHTFQWSRAAGKHLHRQENQNHKHT